jgi:hypothetical protein
MVEELKDDGLKECTRLLWLVIDKKKYWTLASHFKQCTPLGEDNTEGKT